MASARPVLDREQTRQAVAALMKYIGKEKAAAKELFDDDEFLYVVRALSGLCIAGVNGTGIHRKLTAACAARRLVMLALAVALHNWVDAAVSSAEPARWSQTVPSSGGDCPLA